MTTKKSAARKTATKTKDQQLDHPDQAMDTPLPDDTVNEDAFQALQHEAWSAMEGLTEEDVL